MLPARVSVKDPARESHYNTMQRNVMKMVTECTCKVKHHQNDTISVFQELLHHQSSKFTPVRLLGGKEPIVLNRGSTVPLTQTTIDISSQINDIDEHIEVNRYLLVIKE